MKKKIISIAFVAAIAVAAAWNFSQSKAEVELSDMALANVEALASEENDDGTGQLCYHTITTKISVQAFYCGTCTYIAGEPAPFSGKGKCN
jgi:hypothetical protein